MSEGARKAVRPCMEQAGGIPESDMHWRSAMSDRARSEEFVLGNYGPGGQDTGGPGDRRGVEREFNDRALVHYIGLWGAVGIEHVSWPSSSPA